MTFLASSSKDATMYSISRHGQHSGTSVKFMSQYLVTPEQLVSVPVLDPIPCMQELFNAMRPDVVCKLLRVVPVERSANG